MSKKIRLRTAAILAVILILATFAPDVRVTKAQSQSTAVVTNEAKKAAVQEATESVLKETSELRQLPILRAVKSDTQSRTDIEHYRSEERRVGKEGRSRWT